MKAKPKQAPKATESVDALSMDAGTFDEIMRGALQVVPVKAAHAAAPKSDRKRRTAKGRPTTA